MDTYYLISGEFLLFNQKENLQYSSLALISYAVICCHLSAVREA